MSDFLDRVDVLNESGVQELHRLRLENHRLRELVRAADVVHIRLRDVLRTALERVAAVGDEADRVWTADAYERHLK